MNWDRGQLAALAAVVEHGTFDAAAGALAITPSAVSQRIRALETRLGQVAVTRSRPCTPTPAGAELVRLAKGFDLLESETARRLGPASGRVPLAVVVNADSLATWFRQVLAAVAGWDDVTLRLFVDDQEHSAARLRSAEVLAAVTSDPEPVQGCTVHPLGVMRYLPVAARTLLDRHPDPARGSGPTSVDWSVLPMLRFDEKDQLQDDLLDRVAPAATPPVHWVPSSADCAEAVRLGLGWAMLPEVQLGNGLVDGSLVRLAGNRHADVSLHWQRWRVGSTALDRLTDQVVAAAGDGLRRYRTRPDPEAVI
jgi:LysR family transcriptional regulator (chromosome initiation inhibitor)